jgi:hypothetical protein
MDFVLLGCAYQVIDLSRWSVYRESVKEKPDCKRPPMIAIGDQVTRGIDIKLRLLKEVGKVRGELSQPTGRLNVSASPREDRTIHVRFGSAPRGAIV